METSTTNRMIQLLLKSHREKTRMLKDYNPSGHRSLADDIEIDEEALEGQIETYATTWTSTADQHLFWSTSNVSTRLPPGLYKCVYTEKTGHSFQKLIVSTDDLIPLPEKASIRVIEEIQKFWTLKEEFQKRGFLHKRGVLMFGQPGSGKTASIQFLIKDIIVQGGIAIYADDPRVLTGCLQTFRRIEPDRNVIVVLEDFETLTVDPEHENEWLSVLDGESQIDNVVFLATTNYITRLDRRFTDRPSRFDLVQPVSMPSALSRATFLQHKEPSLSNDEVKEWTTRTPGFSYAHLKEMIVAIKCLGHSLDDTVERLREMQKRKYNEDDLGYDPDSSGGGKVLGFTPDDESRTDEDIDWEKFFE